MKSTKQNFILITALVVFIFPSPFLAAEAENYLQKPGLSVFLGLDPGIYQLSTSISGEENRTGPTFDIKGLLSYEFRNNFLLDLGAGWAYKKVSGTRPSGFEGELETRSLFIELDPRYHISKHILIGVFGEFHFGTDLSQKPNTLPIIANEPEQNHVLLVGLEAQYATELFKHPFRIGLRLGTDLDAPNRQIYQTQLSLHYGIQLFESTTDSPDSVKMEVAKVPEKEELKTQLVHGKISIPNFEFMKNSAKPKPKSLILLRKLGAFLLKHSTEFDSISVDGHTDASGSAAYNNSLSQRRADSVKKYLTKEGLASLRIKATGHGFSNLLIPENIKAEANRRVEINLTGIKDEDTLGDAFEAAFGSGQVN